MKRYTYVTTYVVEAPDKSKAAETMEKVKAQLRPDAQIAEHWTILTDVEDFTPEEEHERLGWDECTDEDCDYHNDEHAESAG